MFIQEDQALAARKNAMSFHNRHKIKSLADFRCHEMSWAELNRLESDVKKQSRSLLDKMSGTSDDDAASSLGLAVDGMMKLFDGIGYEKDQRSDLGSKEPREHGGSNNRPGVDPVECRPGGDDNDHTRAFASFLRSPKSPVSISQLVNAEQRAGTTLTGAAGGFVVPEIITTPIMARARDTNPFRSIVRVVEVTSSDTKFPLSEADATSGWVAEDASRSATSEPTLVSKSPTFGTAYSYVTLTEELSADAAINITDWFTAEAGSALGEAEMTAIISGNGTAKPSGLINVAPESAVDGSRTADAFRYLASGTASTLGSTPSDLLTDMVYDLKARYRARGRWLMNSATTGTLRKLKDGSGRPLWVDSMADGEPSRLMGFPVTIAEGMNDIGTNGLPIGFGDFSAAYILATQGGLRVTVDDNVTAPGYVKLYIRHRIGGCVYDENAVRFAKCATT